MGELTHISKVSIQQTRKRSPTPKMRRMVEILVENGGKNLGAAAREAGYSEAQSKNPHQITRSKSWAELMDEYLPGREVVQVHADLLNATTVYKVPGAFRVVPDNKTRFRALEPAYRIRGLLKVGTQKTAAFSLSDLRKVREKMEIK